MIAAFLGLGEIGNCRGADLDLVGFLTTSIRTEGVTFLFRLGYLM